MHDSYFEIGTSHKVCEDYALSGEINEYTYLIVSDGCSSSDGSDIGARILAHAAQAAIKQLSSVGCVRGVGMKHVLENLIIEKCQNVRSTLGLSIDMLDATLLISMTDNKATYNYVWGDGAIIVETDNHFGFLKIEYESGAPYYLSYKMNKSKREAYIKEFPGQRIITAVNGIEETEIRKTSMQSNFIDMFDAFEVGSFKSISLCSDGIFSFNDNDVAGFIKKMLDFKCLTPGFLRRKMQRIKRDNNKSGISHYDDVSIATAIFPEAYIQS